MSFARKAHAAGTRLWSRFDRLPIRVRLAAVSTGLTFVILCGFATVVGGLTEHRIRSDFYSQVSQAADQIANSGLTANGIGGVSGPDLSDIAQDQAVIRLFAGTGTRPFATTNAAPFLGPVVNDHSQTIWNGYLVESRPTAISFAGGQTEIIMQYARPLSEVEATIARVRLFLILGVFGGTALALLAGLIIARRAMSPIARLTSTAREIATTRDTSRSVPEPETNDEVAELARTLDEMLRSIDAARGETEATLVRQRQFVADASHELRTPLTSVLANLELLAESLDGEQGEAARSALRSTQRMRRLVADLLLLARSDIGSAARHEPVDLAQIVVDAAAELGPITADHVLEIDAQPAVVDGAPDDLFRVALNLIENAVRHTPPGTTVRVHTGPVAGGPQDGGQSGDVALVVEDDGPGIPPDIAPTLFNRFVRGAGDRGGSTGLGLAIVRAVALAHGGGVDVESPIHREGDPAPPPGARFTVRLPGAVAEHEVPLEAPASTSS